MKDINKLEEIIKANIRMKKGFIFKRLQLDTIFINKKEYECFYIVINDEKYDIDLYYAITPEVTTNIQSYIFKRRGILTEKEIINIINKYFNINIEYSA